MSPGDINKPGDGHGENSELPREPEVLFHKNEQCHFCGRFVLEVDGWAASVQPYHQVLATWDDERTFFSGAHYHLQCLRTYNRRAEVRKAFADWITTDDTLLPVRGADGQDHELNRIGLGFTERIAELPSGEIYENPRFDRWVFIEYAGPFHILDARDTEALGHGGRVRGDTGGGKTVLPVTPPARFAKWALPELLSFLEISDCYQDMVDTGQPEYQYLSSGKNSYGFVLGYSLSALLPIPEDVTKFFRKYLPEYIPKRLGDV
ncbi:hypothetical protein [Streptomyces anulatus]|uniref:hypothetical protein n=1 Tax=Streptomyces anulatus TaxID=1892 RepID=UPI0036D9D264